MKTLTRTGLAEALWREVGLPRADAERFVADVIETLTERLAAGETVKIADFASFAVRARGARTGRNPKTGEPAMVPARPAIAFHPSRALKAGVARRLSGGTAAPPGPGWRGLPP